MPAKDFYVAIELGSSKITGIAGQKKMDGSITVLAAVTEEATSCIRKGVVYNIDKTSQQVKNIIQKLQNQLQTEITLLHVGVAGQGIRSVLANIVRDFDQAMVIDHASIDAMMDQNRGTRYPGQVILDVATQEFKVDSQYQLEPVGIECNRLEGNFLNILWRDSFERNLNKCFEQAGMPRVSYYLAPMALADCILSDTERRTGCMLVDLGSGTTTISIYHKNILRHMVTIPMGGQNVTKDIAAFQIDDVEAETIKLKHASAYTNSSDINPDMKLSITPERSIPQRDFISMVEARTEEIIKNVIAQIPSEYVEKLVGGIILTGGMSNMKNIEQAFRKYSNIDKIRIAHNINTTVNIAKGVTIAHNGTMCSALALLSKADEMSSGRPMDEVTSMFNTDNSMVTPGVVTPAPTRNINELKPGQIPTKEERLEEERKRLEEEEKKLREAEEEEQKRLQQEEEDKRKAKENSLGNKLKRGFTKFITTLTSGEDE